MVLWPKLFPARLWSRLYDEPKCTSILKCELIKRACYWLLIGIVCVYVGGYTRQNCWFNEYVWVSRFYRGIATGDLFLMMSKSLLYSLWTLTLIIERYGNWTVGLLNYIAFILILATYLWHTAVQVTGLIRSLYLIWRNHLLWILTL